MWYLPSLRVLPAQAMVPCKPKLQPKELFRGASMTSEFPSRLRVSTGLPCENMEHSACTFPAVTFPLPQGPGRMVPSSSLAAGDSHSAGHAVLGRRHGKALVYCFHHGKGTCPTSSSCRGKWEPRKVLAAKPLQSSSASKPTAGGWERSATLIPSTLWILVSCKYIGKVWLSF